MKKVTSLVRKEISLEEISVPVEDKEELESIHYCNIADSQL